MNSPVGKYLNVYDFSQPAVTYRPALSYSSHIAQIRDISRTDWENGKEIVSEITFMFGYQLHHRVMLWCAFNVIQSILCVPRGQFNI